MRLWIGAMSSFGRGRDDGAGLERAVRPLPALPQAGEGEGLAVAAADQHRLLAPRPRASSTRRSHRRGPAPAAGGRRRGRPASSAMRLGPGVDHPAADRGHLGPARHQAPAHHGELALAVGVEADDRHRLRRRDVEARLEVRPLPREAEGAPEIVDRGVEQVATAHGADDRWGRRRRQARLEACHPFPAIRYLPRPGLPPPTRRFSAQRVERLQQYLRPFLAISPVPSRLRLGRAALARSASHSGSRFPGSNFAAASGLAQSGRPALRAPSKNSAAELPPGW